MMNRVLLFLVIVFSSTQVEARELFGDWIFDAKSGSVQYSEAFTVNESGSKIGFICDRSDQKCFYYLWPLDTTCTNGVQSALLMSTSQGGTPVETVCLHFSTMHLLVFKNFKIISNAFKNSDYVGFAAAMKDGGFKSFKFSLKGSNIAIQKAAAAVIRNTRPSGNSDHYF